MLDRFKQHLLHQIIAMMRKWPRKGRKKCKQGVSGSQWSHLTFNSLYSGGESDDTNWGARLADVPPLCEGAATPKTAYKYLLLYSMLMQSLQVPLHYYYIIGFRNILLSHLLFLSSSCCNTVKLTRSHLYYFEVEIQTKPSELN